MQQLTAEWVAKAEGDYKTATREFRVRRDPNYDAAAYHAQQCAGKYLKAQLQEPGLPFPRTHDLEVLLNLLVTNDPIWNTLRAAAQYLSALGINVRYPGFSATKPVAQQALTHAAAIRAAVRTSLGA